MAITTASNKVILHQKSHSDMKRNDDRELEQSTVFENEQRCLIHISPLLTNIISVT